MHIAVNLLPFRARLAGAGHYTLNLLRELLCADAKNEYTLFVRATAAPHFEFAQANVKSVIVKLPESTAARLAYEQLVLPVHLERLNADVLFTASVAIPIVWRAPLVRGKTVTVIYDMIADAAASTVKYPPLRRAYVRWMSHYAAGCSDAVITISENSRREIARYARVPQTKIHLAPPGVGPGFQRVSEPARLAAVRERYWLPERFILYLGTLEPGKNLARLVRAFARLRREHPELEQHLVLAGEPGWGVSRLETEIRQSDAVGLHLPGFVQEEDLATLYSLADLFVYPSFYEGFGMPLLEAMACGTPVIVSNVSALPEVIGTPWTDPASHAGLLVSPNDEKGWAQAMARILAEDTLRERLIANGLTRAAQFRWETSAGIVRGVLEAFGV